MSPADAVIGALADQQAELSHVLADRQDADWGRPTRCEGWTVADVVLHLAQTNELAIASATRRFPEALSEMTGGLGPAGSVDDGAALMVARDRRRGVPATRARWRASVDELQLALRSCDPHRRLVWVAGELSARTLATTRLAETWIHTGDVADALGAVLAPTDRLWHIARLAWRTLPYAFERAGRTLSGPVAFSLQAPTGGAWEFGPEAGALTTVHGDALELCLVAARRIEPAQTRLVARGPDARAVLELIRTYA